MRMLYGAILAASLLLIVSRAHAVCDVGATGVDFGDYDVYSSNPTDSTGTIVVVCNERSAIRVTIEIGPSPNSGGFSPRQMRQQAGTDLLEYNLYTRASRDRIWGDGTSGTYTVSRRVRRGRPWRRTVFGRIPAGQDVSQGLYGESLTVTITW